MDKKSERVLVEVLAEHAEIVLIDRVLANADPGVVKISTQTHPAKCDSAVVSYKIDQEALAFVALSDDWLYTRLRMFPPISLKDSYRKKA